MGNLYRTLADFRRAEECYTEVLQIHRKLADKDPNAYQYNVAGILFNLGNLYIDLKNFKMAEECYREALYIRRKLAEKDPDAYLPDVAMTLNNLANLYNNLGDFEKAEKFYKEALENRESLPDKGARTYLGLAVLAEEGKSTDAAQFYLLAGVTSLNLFTRYGTPSVDFLQCFKKTQELSDTDSPYHRMAKIALTGISRITNPKQPPQELSGLKANDLPNVCQAIVAFLLKKEIIQIEEPKNEIEIAFFLIYEQLKNISHPTLETDM